MKLQREIKVPLDPQKDVIFQIVSWYANDEEYDDDCEDDRMDNTKYLVKLFGVTEAGLSVSVNLMDYTPFFFVKAPFAFNDFQLKMFKEYVIEKLPFKLKNGVHDVKIIKKKDFWGFTNSKKFVYIRLSFKNIQTFRTAHKFFTRKIFIPMIKQEPIFYKLYENNIDPFLRLAHIKDINPAGWIKIPGGKYDLNNDLKTTRCQLDLSIKWTQVESVYMEKMAPLVIASFDIECTSSHGDFPTAQKTYKKTANELIQLFNSKENMTKDNIYEEIMMAYDRNNRTGKLSKVYPKDHINPTEIGKRLGKLLDDLYSVLSGKTKYKDDTKVSKDTIIMSITDTLKALPTLQGDPIIQIGTTVHTYGEMECSLKHVVTLGSCDPIDGCIVDSCKTERELILKWRDFITSLDPDIMIGYNIFGFDMSYIYDRAKENDIEDLICEIGKIHDHQSKFEEKKLSSSALGDNLLKYIDMEGRVLIDLMKIVQRDHKLDSYKLDNVANTFLGGKIISIIDDTTCIFDNIKGISIDSFVKLESDDKYMIINIEKNETNYTIKFNQELSSQDKKSKKWGLAKDDITPRQIFECQNGSSKDRALVAKYCMKDSALCNYLLMKLETLANNVGMANVCSVPLSYIFMRGQGIKIFSLVAKQCREDDFIIPTLSKYQNKVEEEEEEEGYEGAIVLEPKEGIYTDMPITVLDYASLYPSSMISENLSQDCIVLDSKYDNLEGFEYLDIVYDIYEKQGNIKVKTGERKCRFVQLPEKGVIPRILMNLLKQRKFTRKKIEFKTVTTESDVLSGMLSDINENEYKLSQLDGTSKIVSKKDVKDIKDTYDDFQKAVLDGLQLAYKVTANSLYGQCGAKTSQIYMKDIAACTTATGRNMILKAKDFIEKNYDAEIIYGDSVVGYTPTVLRIDGKIVIEKFENIATKYCEDKWIKCSDGEKQGCEVSQNIEVWTSSGWTKLKTIIRHTFASHKSIIRILTHTGVVDVTDEHSLINDEHDIVDAKNVKVGDKLLHSQIPIIEMETVISEEQARIMGMFMGDGSCGIYKYYNGLKPYWTINNRDMKLLEVYKDLCSQVYPYLKWKIIPNVGCYTLSPKRNKFTKFVNEYKNIMYDGMDKIVPSCILNGPINIKRAFWRGLCDGDKDIDQDSQISAATIYMLGRSIGYKVSINTRKNKYRLTMTQRAQRKHPHKIKKIQKIDYEGYVYDFTTENHEFAGGVGEIIVHNTDSLFVKFQTLGSDGKPIKGKAAIPKSRELGIDVSSKFKSLIKHPHDLEYEKIFYPFILFSKKRYCANKYEFDDHKCKMNSMGIALKRRDNAQIVKTIYGGVLDIILNEQNIRKSIIYMQDNIRDLIEGKYPMEELIITKSLKSDYKDPDKIAHKVLAERMGERDEGTRPQVNDRIPFVYILKNDKKKKVLQGERIEHPDYIRSNNLKPDYEFYITNQIMKPCLQLYALVLEQLDGYKANVNYSELMKKLLKEKEGDIKKAKEKWNDLRETEVKKLLFDPYLIKLQNKKNNNCDITDFFKPSTS